MGDQAAGFPGWPHHLWSFQKLQQKTHILTHSEISLYENTQGFITQKNLGPKKIINHTPNQFFVWTKYRAKKRDKKDVAATSLLQYMMKEKYGKRDKEKDLACLVTAEVGGAEYYVHKTKTSSQSSTAIEEKTQYQLNKITCTGKKARLKAQLLSRQESEQTHISEGQGYRKNLISPQDMLQVHSAQTCSLLLSSPSLPLVLFLSESII